MNDAVRDLAWYVDDLSLDDATGNRYANDLNSDFGARQQARTPRSREPRAAAEKGEAGLFDRLATGTTFHWIELALAIYFGRCLASLVCVLGVMGLRVARSRP